MQNFSISKLIFISSAMVMNFKDFTCCIDMKMIPYLKSLHIVCKINIDSDLRLAMTASVREHLYTHPDHFDPRQYLKPGREAIKQMVMHKIQYVLGCENKA